MVCYAASALGLLLATQFLGLRRYLRERGVKMPRSIIARWLSLGAKVIVGVLVVSALLPRPWPEYSLADLGSASTDDRGSAHGKGSGKVSDEGSPQATSSASHGSGGSQGSSGSGSGSGSSETSGSSRGSTGDQSGSAGPRPTPKRPPVAPPAWLTALGPLMIVLKWIIAVIAVVVVAIVVLRSGLGFLANFTGWAARLLAALSAWWNGWFGEKAKRQEMTSPAEAREPMRPFAVFANPFANGAASNMSPDDLVQYTFDAVQSWAAERGLGRHADETPFEFTERLVHELPELQEGLEALAEAYGRMAYAGVRLPEAVRSPMQALWARLERATAIAA
jgi:hypothetical protein